ncbi:glycosyltransferase family 2 protein [Mariniflexile maritimum]|uniref:glycosyltransferase family 2 protein n=1 Tax=Mariniflexile maritimum TaxID=2682493 RepID=UPI0012F62970|nr:glycosyltransferase family A protein [Mariniflexile maritimum]
MEHKLQNNSLKLEVLISTMHRVSLHFVDKMFPFQETKNMNILIINQTERGKELQSIIPNIRVINSYDKGLSKSRNLALQNAKGDICLIADDDVEYFPNFEYTVKKAFISFPEASIIRFKINTFSGEQYKLYSLVSKRLFKKREIENTSSIEIAFMRQKISNEIYFNANFGLGSYFTCGEEYLFLKEALKKNKQVYFVSEAIVKHSVKRSTSNMADDQFVKAQAALYYHDYKELSYLYLVKLLFFLFRKGLINKKQMINKYKIGVLAIKTYKKIK